MLWHSNEFVVLLSLIAGLVFVTELGYRVGRRHADRGDDDARSHCNNLQASVLGLLALLLGFTFYMAASRFDARRTLELDEADAIGTTFLRSQMLAPELRDRAKTLLREHVAARLAFFAAGVDTARIESANSEAARTEGGLWALAREAAAEDPRSIPTGLFIEALNEMIDLHEKRQVAFESHVPEAVLDLLIVVAAASFALLGYGCGLAQRRRYGSTALFASLIALVFTLILDIDRPRRGVITVSQDSLLRVQVALGRGTE